jgi:uncharacterized protein (DUF342 family)
MQYNVEVLKKLIDNRTSNIEMFAKYDSDYARDRMYEMVKERRDLAALVENDGVLDENMVRPDSMLYTANTPGTDTSWWTRGT